MILVGQYLVRLKTGLLDSFSPTPIQRPKDSDKNTLVYVENCPLCGEGFHCNDIVVSSCGHTYHPFCMSSHSSKFNRYIAEFCDEDFDPNWRLSFGFAELTKHDSSPNVIHDNPCPGGMFLEIYTPNATVLCFSISNSCILFFSLSIGVPSLKLKLCRLIPRFLLYIQEQSIDILVLPSLPTNCYCN